MFVLQVAYSECPDADGFQGSMSFRIFQEGALKFNGRHQILDHGHGENLLNENVSKMKGNRKLFYFLTRSVDWIIYLEINHMSICLHQTAG
jgi:hypothetical protein